MLSLMHKYGEARDQLQHALAIRAARLAADDRRIYATLLALAKLADMLGDHKQVRHGLLICAQRRATKQDASPRTR